MRDFKTYVFFLVLVFGGGTALGFVTRPGDWYAQLVKPDFTPPSWIFGPVWSILYILIALAGARTWKRAPRCGAMEFWGVQLILNFLWSPIFFGAHRIRLAFGVIVLLLISIGMFIWCSWKEDRGAALMFLPYLAWVSFAAVLNGSLLVLNR